MAHLDFRAALSTPDEKLFSPAAAIAIPLAAVPSEPAKDSFFAGLQLSRSALTNIIFVAIAATGGLLCGFYFFNGGEVLRAAASWPSEFLYPRPLATDKIDIGVQPNPVDSFSTTSSTADPASSRSNAGSGANAPTNFSAFSPTFGPTAPTPVGTTPFVPPSILPPPTSVVDPLTELAPGSGTLLQNLFQTAGGITTTAMTATKSTTTKLKSARRKLTSTRPKASTLTNVARSTAAKSATQTMHTVQQSSSQTQLSANSIQTASQSMMGTGVGGVGGAGGVGGVGGAGAGGVGGVGGMGGVGGLGGGLGGVGGLGSVGGGVGGVGVLPGHH